MPLISAKNFKITVQKCPGDYHVVRVEITEYLGREEFKKKVRLFNRLYLGLESKRPWVWARAFRAKAEAEDFAGELCLKLGELCYMDEELKLRVVKPAPEMEEVPADG